MQFFFLLFPLFTFEAMRFLSLPSCGVLIIITTILFSNYVCARPKMVVSRECESAWCVNVPSLSWDSLLGAGSATVRMFQGILNGFVTPQSSTSPTLPTNDVEGDVDKGSDERAWPNSSMESALPGEGQDQCRNNVPDLQPGETNTIIQQCRRTTKQIVWPVGCEMTADMVAMEELLKSLDSKLLTSTQPSCPVSDGVFFWAGEFSRDQINLIKSYSNVIAGVEPNQPLDRALSKIKKDKSFIPRPSLQFVSTAPGKVDSGTYAYFLQEKPQAQVSVFLLDAGYASTHSEFKNTKVSWLYAEGTAKYPEGDRSGHGTCMLSALLGDRFGVAKRAPHVVMTKISGNSDSVLDALNKIINLLTQWQKYGHVVAGFTVIHLSALWKRTGFLTDTKLRALIEELVKDFQVVIVVAAGQDKPDKPNYRSADGNVYLIPATYSLDYDIITVGAVIVSPKDDPVAHGTEYAWSHGGPAVTVHAPGNGRCAVDKEHNMDGFEDVTGTSIASAYTAGLVAYFLGLPDLGPHLRSASPNVPKAVKEYVQQKAWARNAAVPSPAIWNGIDAEDAKTEWTYWIGDSSVDY